MNIITVDFETYYDKYYSLVKLTTEQYIRDKEFEVILVGLAVNDTDPVWFSGTFTETRAWLMQFDWANSFVLAHNTMFDGAILAWKFGIKPKGWLDTLSMSRALHGVHTKHSLKALAERYGLKEKGDQVLLASGMYRCDMDEEFITKYAEYCCNDVDITRDLFAVMTLEGLGGGFPAKELKVIDATLNMFIYPVLQLNANVLCEHLKETSEKKEQLLENAGIDKSELMSNAKFAAALTNLDVPIPTKPSPTTGKLTYAFAKTDEEFVELLNHENPTVQALVSARLGLKSTLEETRTQRLIEIAQRGPLPVPIKYYGAKTGRWSGMESINLQNVPRKSALKVAIEPPPGYMVVGADLSNIELRVGLRIAGQLDKLKILGDGQDLYKDFASSVFNVPYDEVDDDQRFIGKTSELSLIFGVGAERLRNAIKTSAKKDIGADAASSIVQLYRRTRKQVVNAWNNGELCLEAIANDKYTEYGDGGLFPIHGKKGVLLPSGLYMMYPDLLRSAGGWTVAAQKAREHIYAAKFFQGLVQATARCIIAEQMVKLRKSFTTALIVHDALYGVVPTKEAEKIADLVKQVMTTPPTWMPDIPLDSKVKIGRNLSEC